MPDNEINLKDVHAVLLRVEALLQKLCLLADGAKIEDGESPFWDPDKQAYDIGYYRSNHPKDEGTR